MRERERTYECSERETTSEKERVSVREIIREKESQHYSTRHWRERERETSTVLVRERGNE